MNGLLKPSVYDVIIVGAGISGINTAYFLQTQLPDFSYTILEGRDAIGGTWDLFRYPGIRSDSDLHTFGFSFRPWRKANPIATGDSILQYLNETASIYGIDKHIQFRHKVISTDWSSKRQLWTLTLDVEGQPKKMDAKFIIMGTGYYDYKEPLKAIIPGIENFKGEVVHPQFWPKDFDYSNKKVVIIGSGATAVTLLPSLADKTASLTMLQRSPSYQLSVPNSEKSWINKYLPFFVSYYINRLKFLILPLLFYKFSMAFPNAARNMLKKATEQQLPKNIPYDPHFSPSYGPWAQRLCACPDGDFFKSLRNGKANVVTDHINRVNEHSISLDSGDSIDADVIITATGLKIQVGGGSTLSIDGTKVNPAEKFMWKNTMLQDVPNMSFIVGYVNASWTLGAETTALLICRLLRYLKANQYSSAVPKLDHPEKLKTTPVLNLDSTYIKAAVGVLPKTGTTGPWKPRDNYFLDLIDAKYGNFKDSMHFERSLAA